MSENITLERNEDTVRVAMRNIGAMEVLCWPYDGQVWAVINESGQVTHAMPKDAPQDNTYESDDAYSKSVTEELTQFGVIRAGMMTSIGGRYYFKPTS